MQRWIGLEPPTPAHLVRVEHDWIDDEREVNDEGRGELAYTNYLSGDGDEQAEVSFSHLPNEKDFMGVYLFGRDEVDLDQVERTLDNLLALLSDPRVKAARAAAVQR